MLHKDANVFAYGYETNIEVKGDTYNSEERSNVVVGDTEGRRSNDRYHVQISANTGYEQINKCLSILLSSF